MRVNIKEFQEKYIKGALIPEDIMEQFADCFLQGDEYADIRDTVYDEIKIRQFYNEHPALRPKTDWVTPLLCRKFIDILKSHIKGENIDDAEVADLQKQVAIFIDKRKVNAAPNEPYDDLQDLYEDIVWFRCEILLDNK